MRTAWLSVVLACGLAACTADPADRLKGEWELVNDFGTDLPMPKQRTVFRFENDHVNLVEHWLNGSLVSVDSNWYTLSTDGTTLDVTGPMMRQDTLHLHVQRCDADSLELLFGDRRTKARFSRSGQE
jgi:hypothetical protein